MRADRARRIPAPLFAIVLVLMAGFGSARSLAGQVVSGHDLTGDWVRIDSNNDPNDLMRITIGGTTGILTSVPAAALANWSVGDALWQRIQASGSLEVRGSDGNYYPATIAMSGPDEIALSIHYPGGTPGDAQLWRRAGADISGDWVRIGPPGTPGDGTRIQVAGVDASVRYLTATAPRSLRIGTRIWQGIGASGGLQVLGTDRNYHAATWTLLAPDRLQVDAPAAAGGAGQIWVRPGIVASARQALQQPNPNAPTAGLRPLTPLPGVPTTPSTPPTSSGPTGTCVSTARPFQQSGGPWGWDLTVPTRNSPIEHTIGVANNVIASFDANDLRRNRRAPIDIERSLLPGLQDGFSFVWERSRQRWDERRDMTSTELDQVLQAARSSGGVPTDIEAYQTPSGLRYAAIWVTIPQNIAWILDYDLTAAEYGQEYPTNRNDGYRLVDIEAYQTSNGLRYAALWHASCDNANWRGRRDLDRTEYQQWVDTYAQQGFRVVDFESYQTSGGQRYAAIWEFIPAGTGWNVRTDRTLTWFLNYHRRSEDLGLKLIDYESYDTANGIRYAGVWAENDPRYDFSFKSVVDTMVENYRGRHAIPGMSVVIMDSSEVIYRRGFGWADSLDQKWAHARTIFLTASIAKAIGGTLAARLEELGRIDLTRQTASITDDIRSGHTHTVEQLLSKTGCIRHYDGALLEPNESRNSQGNIVVAEKYYRWRAVAIDSIESPILPNCTPGQNYLYSTLGYTFAGAALEEVMRKDMQSIIADEMQLPYQLLSLHTVGAFPVAGPSGPVPFYDMAQGYRFNTGTGLSTEVDYEDSSWKILGGGLQIHAMDLAKFGWMTYNGDIVGAQTRDNRLWAPLTGSAVDWRSGSTPATTVSDTTALAWLIERRAPVRLTPTGAMVWRPVAEHGGTARGARSILRIYRQEGLILVILSNQRNSPLNPNTSHPIESMSGGPNDLATRVASAVFADPPP